MSPRIPLLTVLLAAPLFLSADLSNDDPPSPVPPKIPATPLGVLREDRSRWLGEEVRFVFQLDQELKAWNPWVTRFGSKDYHAFSIWEDASFLWRAEDFKNTIPRLFIRRGAETAKVLTKARRFERFEVRVVVRSIFLDEPWIEVLEIRPLERRVSRGTILHGTRALKMMGERHFGLALGELERARAGRLPAAADRELRRLEQSCRDELSGS